MDDSTGKRTVGIVANPMSGRDVRRLAARASTITNESKRDQIGRAVVGAVAAGAERVLVVRDPFRIAPSAVENLDLSAEIEVLDLPITHRSGDSAHAARTMREKGCGALVVLGGDGTNRAVAQGWRDAPLVPLSTGTNNVFPVTVEATLAGVAAGLVATGRVAVEEATDRAKLVHVAIEGEPEAIALVDATFLVHDRVGNLLPFDPAHLRRLILARAEPAAVGMSPIGGLLEPCGAGDAFGVDVVCTGPDGAGRPLLAPVSPGLFRQVNVKEVRRIELGERALVSGPGLLAFDGDRERELQAGQVAELRVLREGPRVIDVARTLSIAAKGGFFFDRTEFHDGREAAAMAADLCC